jgi:hypothetical protein
MEIKSDVKVEWDDAALQRGMRAAVEAHLRSKIAAFRCEEHGETPRLVGEGEAWEIESCCPTSVERATRGLKR